MLGGTHSPGHMYGGKNEEYCGKGIHNMLQSTYCESTGRSRSEVHLPKIGGQVPKRGAIPGKEMKRVRKALNGMVLVRGSKECPQKKEVEP